MTELSSVASVVTVWLETSKAKQVRIRRWMGDLLGIGEYNEDSFTDKFRRDPPKSAHYQLDELLALIQAFQKSDLHSVSAYHAIRLLELAGCKLADFNALKPLFPADEFNQEWQYHLENHQLLPAFHRENTPSTPVEPVPAPQFIVGRNTELAWFQQFTAPQQKTFTLFSIFGPGGIGKTVVANRFQTYAADHRLPIAFVNGQQENLTRIGILGEIAHGFMRSPSLQALFESFEALYTRYGLLETVLTLNGGVDAAFDVIGRPKTPAEMSALIDREVPVWERATISRLVENGMNVKRFLHKIEGDLMEALSQASANASANSAQPLTLLVDTFEEMRTFDYWFSNTLVPQLVPHVRFAILGRNVLRAKNHEWGGWAETLSETALPPLNEIETVEYLHHYRLTDPEQLKHIWDYTQGYPLLLVLVRNLAESLGGWERLGKLENPGDRFDISMGLLNRILREERVEEVRAFLEKGVVVEWFDPGMIGAVLDISLDDARLVYERIRQHSFVERHPMGLKFHDVVREKLRDRLLPAEQAAIRVRARAYLKANIDHDET